MRNTPTPKQFEAAWAALSPDDQAAVGASALALVHAWEAEAAEAAEDAEDAEAAAGQAMHLFGEITASALGTPAVAAILATANSDCEAA